MSSLNEAISAKTIPQLQPSRSIYRTPVLKTLKRFALGRLEMLLPDGEKLVFGQGDTGKHGRIIVRDEAFFRKCALSGGVGLGESYIEGDWDTEDIQSVIEWFIVNLHADRDFRGSSQKFRMVGFLQFLDKIGHRLRHNSKETSRRNIEEHYDLGKHSISCGLIRA